MWNTCFWDKGYIALSIYLGYLKYNIQFVKTLNCNYLSRILDNHIWNEIIQQRQQKLYKKFKTCIDL